MAFRKNQFRATLTSWYRTNGRLLPWRQTRDPYAILVSEFMLQQTQVAAVIPYYNEWLRRFPDFAALARAPESDILHAWQGLGYYARARNLHAVAKTVHYSIAMKADFRAIWRRSVNCPVSVVTRPMPSRPSPLISQFQLSKPTLLAFWRGCLIFTGRSIELLAGKSSGSAPARWFQNIPPAFTIRRLSISAH